jgi:hypothetical protein
MRLSFRRILLWLATLALIGAGVALLSAPRRALPPVEDAPWIGLPASGMDASQPTLRQLLDSPFGADHDLADTCGRDGAAPERERYRLQISLDAWRDFRAIELVRRGDWLEVAVRDGFPPPPPEPSRDGTAPPPHDMVRPVATARIALRDAEPIRVAWNTQALWHAEQQPLGCRDGRPVTLEACIAGRYAIRHRNCDPASIVPTQQLWDAVTTLLPAPERTSWRVR